MRFIHNGNLKDMSIQIIKFGTLVLNHFLIGMSVKCCDQKVCGHYSLSPASPGEKIILSMSVPIIEGRQRNNKL